MQVQLQLLTATVKLFLKRPEGTQELVKRGSFLVRFVFVVVQSQQVRVCGSFGSGD
jgi:hypothetical protein